MRGVKPLSAEESWRKMRQGSGVVEFERSSLMRVFCFCGDSLLIRLCCFAASCLKCYWSFGVYQFMKSVSVCSIAALRFLCFVYPYSRSCDSYVPRPGVRVKPPLSFETYESRPDPSGMYLWVGSSMVVR